ncbi:hypothetical protein EXIGLDRAFT_716370 [Exidia glandulosa HHB12029]|uniref:Chromo domain-containing protein n=1 Tax=Exidia glandulosa HHB12029 TaxID=1314781 RepID=A0A165R2N5_EXIGL|nr:hypothetical protein EXIGLDRAFT_716370 [Exidia glandulosa HHB12029]
MPPSRSPKKPGSRSTSGEDNTSPRKKAAALRKKKNKKKQRAESEEEPEVWEVEYIQEMRSVKDEEGKGPWLYEYHIKWLNWEHKDDSWEPRSNFMSDSVIADSFLEHLEQRGIYVPPHARDVPGMSFTPSKEWIGAVSQNASLLRLKWTNGTV